MQHFGKLPKYLQKRIEDEQKALEEYNNFLKEQREQAAMTHVSIEKRKSVLKVSKHTEQEVSLQWNLLDTNADQTSTSASLPLCFDRPGSEENVGPAAPRVPGSPAHPRHHVAEGPQGAPGVKNDAAGE